MGMCTALLAGTVASAFAADAAQHVQVRIEQRKVVEPADGRIVLRQGDEVRVRWQCDEAVALHVHGYDLFVTPEPGKPLSISFSARATGRYPVTSHGFDHAGDHGRHGRALLYLEVQPR
jgi:hypothetical protein